MYWVAKPRNNTFKKEFNIIFVKFVRFFKGWEIIIRACAGLES